MRVQDMQQFLTSFTEGSDAVKNAVIFCEVDGTLYDEDHKNDIIKAFNEMIKIYEYMDLKKYPLNLCSQLYTAVLQKNNVA